MQKLFLLVEIDKKTI